MSSSVDPAASVNDTEVELMNELDGVLSNNNVEPPSAKIEQTEDRSNYDVIELDPDVPNGVLPGASPSPEKLSSNPNLDKIAKLYEKYSLQCSELERVEKQNSEYRDQLLNRIREKDALESEIRELKGGHSEQTRELERKMQESEYQLRAYKERLSAQEQHFRRSMTNLQGTTSAQIEQLKKSAEVAQREKDTAVIKYAQREAEILKLEKDKDDFAAQVKQLISERDALSSGLRGTKNERENVLTTLDSKENELLDLRQELERTKSYIKEADVRVKVAAQRVDDVQNAHKETKHELDQMQKRFREAKEESSLVRGDYQKLIGQFQESEEKKATEMQVQLQEQSDIRDIYQSVVSELDALKKQHRSTMKENEELKCKVNELDERCQWTERELETERRTSFDRQERIEQLTETAAIVDSARQEAEAARLKMLEAEDDRMQAERETTDHRGREERLLELIEQLTASNSQLKTDNSALEGKAESLERQNCNLAEQNTQISSQLVSLEHDLGELRACSSAEIDCLRVQLSDKVKREQELAVQVEDERNENKVIRKKNAASVKELRAELANMKRRLNAYESGAAPVHHNDSRDSASNGPGTLSMSSRASSVTSLDAPQSSRSAETASPTSAEQDRSPPRLEQHVCQPNQAMIEKIVKLQRTNARRSEKVEFLEEHVRQLVEEMQKKTRIIQMYAVREEAGALAPQTVDFNRLLELCEKFYDSHSEAIKRGVFVNRRTAETKVTLELAMEINAKLQAVLEDTLTKNMTLKDNVETLGQEISRLSRAHRQMRLNNDET